MMPPGTVPTQPGQVPSTTPGQPPTLSPVQTPEAAAAMPQTGAFSQAPAAGGEAAFSFSPGMIGDIVGGGVARQVIFIPTPRPSTGNGVPSPGGGTVISGVVAGLPSLARGPFKISENESPRPVDRVFLNYNYFNGVGSGIPGLPLFDVHRQTFGLEKTFLDGDASVVLRMTTYQSTGDGSLSSEDFGDVTAVSKFALINNWQTGNVFTAGLAVTAPTGPDTILVDGSRFHPTLIQPFSGWIYNLNRLYAQGFSSITIPTDSRDALLASNSLAVGYQMYRSADPDGSMIAYLIPVFESHVTTPITHRGLESQPVGFPDLLVLTGGMHIGMGRRSNLLLGVATPVTGPKLFDMEAVAQLNWRY
jgi:hypothetical protein